MGSMARGAPGIAMAGAWVALVSGLLTGRSRGRTESLGENTGVSLKSILARGGEGGVVSGSQCKRLS